VKNIALAVVDLDRGPYAADVQQRLAGSRSFTRLPRYANVAAARGALEREQSSGSWCCERVFRRPRRRPAGERATAARRPPSNAAQITASM